MEIRNHNPQRREYSTIDWYTRSDSSLIHYLFRHHCCHSSYPSSQYTTPINLMRLTPMHHIWKQLTKHIQKDICFNLNHIRTLMLTCWKILSLNQIGRIFWENAWNTIIATSSGNVWRRYPASTHNGLRFFNDG